MKEPARLSRGDLLANHALITQAIQRAAREAIARHAQANQMVATWRDGKVVWNPAQEVLAQLTNSSIREATDGNSPDLRQQG